MGVNIGTTAFGFAEVKNSETSSFLNMSLHPCVCSLCACLSIYHLLNVPKMCTTCRCWRKTRVTEVNCKLDTHLDNMWLLWDGQGNNTGLPGKTVLGGFHCAI